LTPMSRWNLAASSLRSNSAESQALAPATGATPAAAASFLRPHSSATFCCRVMLLEAPAAARPWAGVVPAGACKLHQPGVWEVSLGVVLSWLCVLHQAASDATGHAPNIQLPVRQTCGLSLGLVMATC
jgi:hypothetical protein